MNITKDRDHMLVTIERSSQKLDKLNIAAQRNAPL